MRRLLKLRVRRCDRPWPALELAVGDGPGVLLLPLTLNFRTENDR